jgi:hypothetical protein
MTYCWTAGGNGTYVVHLTGPGGSPTYGNIHSTCVNEIAPKTPGTYSWHVTSGGQSTAVWTYRVKA